jgi:2-keto-3-deoxy-L-fuconate dehydrogenase
MANDRLKGKTVFITAAAQGIGRASAIACAQEGAHVVATDVNEALLQDLAQEHPGIAVHVMDVCSDAQVQSVVASVGEVDVLFNCAGIVVNGTLLDGSVEDWMRSFEINVHGMYRVTRAILPGMLSRAASSGGTVSVINMASMASSIKGFVNRCAYGASKAAVIGLTKSLAADYVKQGLRANALCPGTVDTPSLRARIASAADPVQAEKDFIARQPMGRLGTVDDITPMVVYLASDESRFVSGQALLVDGGVTI